METIFLISMFYPIVYYFFVRVVLLELLKYNFNALRDNIGSMFVWILFSVFCVLFYGVFIWILLNGFVMVGGFDLFFLMLLMVGFFGFLGVFVALKVFKIFNTLQRSAVVIKKTRFLFRVISD